MLVIYRSLSGFASINPHLSNFSTRGIVQIITILSPSRFMSVLFPVVLHYLLTRLYQSIDNITIHQFDFHLNSVNCIPDSKDLSVSVRYFLTSLSVIQFHLTSVEPLLVLVVRLGIQSLFTYTLIGI